MSAGPAGPPESWSSKTMLHAWDHGRDALPAERALVLLSLAGHDALHWPLGERDATLLRVYGQTFGDRFEAHGPCSTCGEGIEMRLSASRYVAAARSAEQGTLQQGAWSVRLRPVTTQDVLRAVDGQSLVRACIVDVRFEGEHADPDVLPTEVLQAGAEHLAVLDPFSEVTIQTRCASCGELASLTLDVSSFVWTEVGRRARALASDVVQLASRFGWSEAEILDMSAARRELYLSLLGAR